MSIEPPALGILCGGFSRRMGRDKADLLLGGEALLARMRRRLGAVASTVLIGTRPDGPGQQGSDVIVLDPEPGDGPLQSMLAMLQRCARPILIVPVDMPFLPVRLGEWLDEQAQDAPAVGINMGTSAEPLPVLLRPLATAELVACCRAGVRRAGAWRDLKGAVLVAPAGDVWSHPPAVHLMGMNTPAEAECAERLLFTFADD